MTDTNFTFSVEGKPLETILKRAVSVLSTSVGLPTFVVESDGKTVFVVAANDEALIKSTLDSVPSGVGAFSFDPADLLGIIKGRAKMEFEFTGQQCSYSSTGKYAGKFNVGAVTKERALSIRQRLADQSTSLAIGQESIATLKAAMMRTAVKDVYQNNVIISYATVKDKKLTVFSRCSNHFAYVTSRLKVPDLALSMPASHFSLIEQVAEGEINITISHSTLRAASGSTILVLPFAQAAEQQFTLVPTYVENLGKRLYQCEVDVAEISKVCDNLSALHTLNAKLDIKATRKSLGLSFSTAKGSATDQLKVKGDADVADVSIDPRVFADCLRVAKGLEVTTLSIYEKCVCFTGEGIYVVGARAS